VKGRVAGQVAVVAGGGSIGTGLGNGRAIAFRLAQEGARVVVADRSEEAAVGTVDHIVASGGTALAVQGDVTASADCDRVAEQAMASFGRLDILVNNVGIPGTAASVVTVEEAEWDLVLDTNLKSVMLMSRATIPRMVDGGSIVNISSIASFREPDRAAYAASKGAVNTLTMAMAAMHARGGIRVNCVAPGQVWTPVVSDTFPGSPEELEQLRRRRRESSLLKTEGTGWDIANAVLFLASPEARWITGQTLLVDGGLHIGRPPSTPFPEPHLGRVPASSSAQPPAGI
jgi:NAD(P)-dependent dehydrogenase (short-subunit alcohol dehydrogenase family)